MAVMSDHGARPKADLAEPKTPMWLPALGALLFLAAGLAWVLTPDSPSSGSAAKVAVDGGAAPK